MKSSSHLNRWKKAALAGLLLAVTHLAQAEDLSYSLKRDLRIERQTTIAEGRRLNAAKRVELGFTPYIFESRNPAMFRHDELTSHALAVHIRRVAGQLALYPGHSLAPDLARIVSR